MKDGWNMTGGEVYVAPVGADPKDPSRWHRMGTLTEMEMRQDDGWCGGGRTNTLTTQGPLTLFKPEPVKRFTTGFTVSTKPHSLDALALYYGTDVINNRGGTRKEEKHMGVRKFKTWGGSDIIVGTYDEDTTLQVADGSDVIINKADVPLIAHALFEKSGWPDAVKDDDGDYVATIGTKTAFGMGITDQSGANLALARAVANLAAYNAWVEGAAEREETAKKEAAAKEVEAARKREHDELRTSAIALEALALYNDRVSWFAYESWDAVNDGVGCPDERVREWIAKAEAARAAKPEPLADWERELLVANNVIKPVPKVGDRVRVSADAKTAAGGKVYFGKGVEGTVVKDPYGWARYTNTRVSTDDPQAKEHEQYVDPKYVTVLATAEQMEAEKAKAERDAGIAALVKASGRTMAPGNAAFYYDAGIRAAA